MNEKHTMPSHLAKLEQEVRELRVVNEYLRNRIGEKNDRIRRLTRLGLVTCEPKHRELWEQEEEL